jgi:Flp pilus assembly protein TadD
MNTPARRSLLVFLMSAGACVFLFSVVQAAQEPAAQSAYPGRPPDAAQSAASQPVDAARKAYAEHIRQTYAFPFGANSISLPGNAAVEGNEFLPAAAFPTAQYCSHCHQEAYAQWRQALHSNSFRTPFYQTSVQMLIKEKGVAYARHCDSCHNPVGVLSGELDAHAVADKGFDRSADGDGVTCMVCHSLERTANRVGNGSYTLAVPSVLVDAEGRRIPGMVPDGEILAHLDRHSKAVMQPFYRSPEFCLACHKANLPVMLNDYKWIRAFTSYDEWQTSKFSKQDPLTFYSADYASCQTCHMQRGTPKLPDPGAKNGTFASHRWLAGNTAVPFYYGYAEQLAKTTAFLQSGNYLNVDLFGLKIGTAATELDAKKLIAPLGAVPFTLPAGAEVEAYVVVQNKNIGHSLIPEVRDLYEAWVAFTVTDAAGRTLYRSGFLRPDGTLDPGAHSFTNRPVDAAGEFVDDHRVWTIHSVAYDNTIQSGRSALVRYRFRLPAGVSGPITVKAAVEYRHLRQTYLNDVLGPVHPAYPVVELASRTRTLQVGVNAPTALLPGDNPEWMRWNNLGIGYLDELQYDDAMHAFEQVVKLRPEYKDGYVNLGLNYIAWEKYREARAPLEKALALAPHDARALYYLALVERRQRHSEAAIADLQEVVRQYPQARDPLRELGISYYQQHRVEDAVATFKALQAVDPDDVAAHYNLAILYHRLGMKQQATYEAAQYAQKRVDPGAPTYSLDYLRRHPELRNESVPWHIHAEVPDPAQTNGGGSAQK